ncbi:hypothetical protein L9F63_001747 [Diploptera punctata]|uniref:Ionotropic glutamate receptor C-terminal domain-containing protein n=1 Tax=Diploptera punctata TaxID=6984 RepID=A0AAD8EIZ6_DIPPU|nr:hypothetical protein L9F63_001747 [Diploptera punctata]
MVNSTQVDASLEPFDINGNLANVIEFLPSIWTSELATYIKRPATLQSKSGFLLAPFSNVLWVCIIGILLILVLMLRLTHYVNLNHREEIPNNFNLHTCLLCVVSIFCQQGHEATPLYVSSQLVFITSLIVGLIIFASYSAVIISFLSVTKSDLPFTTFQGLLDDGTYQFQIIGKSTMSILFQKSTDPVLSRVYLELIRPQLENLPINTTHGAQRLCNSHNVAFMTHRVHLEGVLPSVMCDIIRVPKMTLPNQASIIVSQRNQYYKFLKRK